MTVSAPKLDDARYLAAAVRLGMTGLGLAWPNPAVGCLLVNKGRVVGQGVTGKGGRPHAETVALEHAGSHAKGAVAYVSLEPCNHYGKTGPCTLALIEAGVERVVVAHCDPDPRVSGSGVRKLRDAGIDVSVEPYRHIKAQAAYANRGHMMRTALGRPFVTLKLALSLDGAIGVRGEGPVAITNALTNRHMHARRSRVDAIAVGSRTWKIDAPALSVRLPGLEHRSPRRVVFGQADVPSDVVALRDHDLPAGLRSLDHLGITQVLVEGGATLANSFLDAGLVDEIVLLRGEHKIGQRGLCPFAADPFESLADAGLSLWRCVGKRNFGNDRMMLLQPSNEG